MARYCGGKVLGGRKPAAAWAIKAHEIGVAEATNGCGPVFL